MESTLAQRLKLLVVSIPLILLWNVNISLRHKTALWGVLCLSIFTAIISVIKIAGSNINHINNGQVDTAWALFWGQAEAAVAVIVVSVSAFRALFVAQRASKQALPANNTSTFRGIWSKRTRSRNALPEVPSPTFTGVRTFIRRCPYDEEPQDIGTPMHGSGIRITQNISSELVRNGITSYNMMRADVC